MIGFTWNLLWMLKISDMKSHIVKILQFRCGIFKYFSR